MDLNVCSRRVHDGYATIRTRPRNRPRAVYRSDSEELLKEVGGPYALSTVSNVILDTEQIHQLPRWSDQGKNIIRENYGTLRRSPKKKKEYFTASNAEKKKVLNTFASQKRNKTDEQSSECLYDIVASDQISVELILPSLDSCSHESHLQNSIEMILIDDDSRISSERHYDEVSKNELRKVDEKVNELNEIKSRQPIYAIPNVSGIQEELKQTNEKSNSDVNYVLSGDLYRTTAKYIEDINKNIAEIDKSYEELGYNVRCNSGYGLLDKTSGPIISLDSDGNLYNYPRKRNMAPMPPISPDFGEKSEEIDETLNQPLDLVRPRNSLTQRPNSFGKLPPKLLPRSSSIENTSRHSTGSTTTSSTRSTESLYAISESLTELSRLRVSSICGTIRRRNRSQVNVTENSVTLRKNNRSITPTREVIDPGTESEDETLRYGRKSRVTNTLRRSRLKVNDRLSPSSKIRQINDENIFERRCGTLPCRRVKVSSHPLHKSSEDVLDTVKNHQGQVILARTCSSTTDVRNESRGNNETRENPELYLIDAADIIMEAQMDKNCKSLEHSRQNCCLNQRFSSLSRTRHNSLESDDEGRLNGSSLSRFATLPRRGGTILVNDQRNCNDALPNRRLSGNVPVLEPLYEHAVSDPVKPRGTTNVIPWWELATKKYRHRSCPSLQAHVVSAFEQSLQNMTQRLQQLTATAEKKDSELQELRDTIERLRKQSAEASLNNATSPNGRRHTLGDSDSGTTGCTSYSNHQGSSIARQLSADSVTSLNSLSSACSASSHHKKKGWLRSSFSKAFSRSRKNRHGSVSDVEDCKDGGIGGPGELSAPNSPRLPTAVKHENSQNSQSEKTNGEKSPDLENGLSSSKSSLALYKKEEDVDDLKKQLREKDLMMTDIRLEALSSAHQLVSLKDHINKMRSEMLNLKQDNERLQRLVTSKSLTSSQSSLPSDPDRRFSMTEVASSVAALSNGDHHTSTVDQLEDLTVPEHPVVPSSTINTIEPPIEQDTDGKRMNVAVYLGSENNFNFNLISSNNDGMIGEPLHSIIASVCISNKTNWDALDSTVRRCFKDYVCRVDPITNLGLGVDCLAAYHLGEASRYTSDAQYPELLPCGYLVGHVKTIYLVLSGYSWLAIDTLIPRSIVQRLVSQLTEHRRLILCGPSGAGKSYLAGKLANAFVDSDVSDSKDAAAVATFNVDHNSSKELRQYLVHIAERCASNAGDELPRVIILENLQHATSLGELFSGLPGTSGLSGSTSLLGSRHLSCPAIIGTMSQATCNTTNLQLHHNFRWVLFANNMEPVKGFLGRYLRRKLLEHELREASGSKNTEMAAVVEWLPRVWLHLNKFLEGHSSSDVTIGPRLFLSCPMEVAGSQVWFTDLWNYSVIPYLVETVREGLALYGRRTSGNGNTDGAWEDPTQFIVSSYPWISTHAVHGGSDALLRLRPDDVGYDVVSSGHNSGVGASSVQSLGSTHSDTECDPLLNMLMRLQEAANYSSPQSNDSDSVTSLDSSHTRHSEDLSTSTSSSRGVESAL